MLFELFEVLDKLNYEFGKANYEAYFESIGNEIKDYDDLTDKEKTAWEDAGYKISMKIMKLIYDTENKHDAYDSEEDEIKNYDNYLINNKFELLPDPQKKK